MSEYLSPAWWCVLQTVLVASLGVAATWLLGRRSPSAAALAAGVAAATILAVTVLIPAPMPLWTAVWQRGGDVAARSSVAGPNRLPESGLPESGLAELSEPSMGVGVGALIRRLQEIGGAGRAKPQAAEGGVGDWAAAIVAMGAAWGLARFAVAMRFVGRLRRESESILDAQTLGLFHDVRRQLDLRQAVELRQSARLVSAAVIGWRRPAVLLPAAHVDWGTEQLRAALAHELAHVARGDFAWRAAASLAQAIHFVNPLVHGLSRRLVLAQELAADELAAAAAGGPAIYLRALSELAVRLDDGRGHDSRLRAEPIVLPALSSHLMRRIAMLRSKEGSTAGGRVREARRSAAGVLAAGLIVLLGMATMALRGSAEPVTPTNAQAAATPAENATLFAREPLDPAILRRPDAGVFVLRLAEMSERPALVPLVDLYERCLQDGWKRLAGVDMAPEIHLEEVEYVAGAATMQLKPKTTEQMGRMMLSCEEFIVRFKRPVAWKDWTLANYAGAEEVQGDGFAYVALPTSPWLGKLQFFLAARDAQTVVASANVERLRAMATGDAGVEPHGSTAQWKGLDGGLMAFLAPLKSNEEGMPSAEDADEPIDPATLDDDPGAAVIQAITLNVQELGGGIDLASATNNSGVRVCMTCADQAKADLLKKTLEARRLQALAFLQAVNLGAVVIGRTDEDKAFAPTDGGEDAIDQEIRWMLALLGSSHIQMETRDDGRVDLRIEAQAEFPALVLRQFAARKTKADAAEVK